MHSTRTERFSIDIQKFFKLKKLRILQLLAVKILLP